MTPQQRESVIDRVRKLLALAAPGSGATEAEREQAQRRAADLMTRHDLEVFDLEDADKGAVGQDGELIDGIADHWRGELAGRIVEAMGGDWFYQPGRSRKVRRYVLVGRPDTVAFARMLTEHLVPWLEIECEAAYHKALAAGEVGVCSRCAGEGWTWGGRFCDPCAGTGAVPLKARVFRREFYKAASLRIASRLRMQRRDTADEVRGSGSGMELVRVDRAAIDRYYERTGIELARVSAKRSGGSLSGHVTGLAAGARADLTPGAKVGAGARPELTA